MTQSKPREMDVAPSTLDQTTSALLSHDIRSALSRIMSAGQVLEGAGLSGADAPYLKQIHTAALYINDLLALVSTEAEQEPLSEIEPLLAQVEALWAPEATKKGLGFSIVRKGELPGALRLPKIDFLRIFNNIIGNAMKFSSSGALGFRLARIKNGALLFEVVDDGPGFRESAQEKLFSLHGRPENEVGEGTGFGLYIARKLVENAGGEITAENRPSGGARVSVIFPEDVLIAAQKLQSKPDIGMPDLSHLRILLAEDNPTNQLVATQMLKKMGARVETAADGVEALAAFENGNFNLGLIDIEMPRKSGLEVMRAMRARKDGKAKITLLALTAYVLSEHKERILAAGANGIIAKPLTDIAAFGNGILSVTGAQEVAIPATAKTANPDAIIEMDVYDGLKKIIGKESMKELLGKVQSDLADVRTDVRRGVDTKDAGPIRASTHILISVAGAFGAVNLQHLAEALNATAKTGDWGRIVPEAKRCEKGISDVLQFVDRKLER